MVRHSHGFKRVGNTLKWHEERNWGRVNQELVRLRQLIRAAAERAAAIGVSYPEFDALIDEVKSWPESDR